MSDFVTELRREVVGAHAAHRHRSARARRLRRWRPALAGAVALAALLGAVVVAVRSLPAPEPTGEPHVVKVLPLGGIPVDGASAVGSVWVSDTARNQVVRIDAAKRRVAARIPLGASPEDISGGPAGVWVRTTGSDDHTTTLWRIDPRNGRVVSHIQPDGGTTLAVGADAVWAARRFSQPEAADRFDAAGGRRTARVPIPDIDGLALGGGMLWVVRHNGSVIRVDAASGRILHRWPQLAPSDAGADSSEAVVADATGAWVLSTENAKLYRLQGDRVTRELDVDAGVPPILARTRDGLWVAVGDDLHPYRVTRIDPRSGEVTASVDLGAHRPRAIVPVAGGLWVVGGDGTAVLIDS